MAPKTIDIAGRKVGPGQPCFIIAEAGVNHNGRLDLARRMIDAAVEAQVDAVKFQAFRAGELASAQAPKAAYQLETTGQAETQLEMLRRLELSETDQRQVKGCCQEKGVIFLSSPFDLPSIDLLADLGVPAYKVPSGEITNPPYLARVAAKGKPIILSTGMASLDEVAAAVEAIRRAGNEEIVLLHCVSNYPADPAAANLRAMATMAEAFKLPIGYSDHTPGIEVALAATALGACVIEKHFTLDRNLPGPDHQASSEPDELAALVRGVRKVESALGHGVKEPAPSEAETAAVARKSLIAARDIAAGEKLTEDVVAIKRPGTGLPPAMLDQVIGRTARQDIPAETVIRLEMLS